MAVPKVRPKHVTCVVVGAVRLDTSRWMVDLACGNAYMVASVGRPRSVRMACAACTAKARAA